MKKSLLLTSLLATNLVVIGAAQAAPIFPRAGQSTNGPAITITLTDSGPTLTTNSDQTYDGNDDVEIALINSSSTTQSFITLSGTGNGGGLFAFDGDGIGNGNYIDANTGLPTPGNPADTTGYAGPGITFSNISPDETFGQVNFNLAPGASTYFSLESSPSSINNGGGPVIGGGGGTAVPEPASLAVIGSGLLGLLAYRRRA